MNDNENLKFALETINVSILLSSIVDPVARMLQTQQMMQATMQQLLQNLNLASPSRT